MVQSLHRGADHLHDGAQCLALRHLLCALNHHLDALRVDLQKPGGNCVEVGNQGIAKVVLVEDLVELSHCECLESAQNPLGLLHSFLWLE